MDDEKKQSSGLDLAFKQSKKYILYIYINPPNPTPFLWQAQYSVASTATHLKHTTFTAVIISSTIWWFRDFIQFILFKQPIAFRPSILTITGRSLVLRLFHILVLFLNGIPYLINIIRWQSIHKSLLLHKSTLGVFNDPRCRFKIINTIFFASSIFLTPVCLAMLYSVQGGDAQVTWKYPDGYCL